MIAVSTALARQQAWTFYSDAIERFLAARPGSPEFGPLLARANSLEMVWERAEMLADGRLADAEAQLCLEVVVDHLRPRVRESTIRAVFDALDQVLAKLVVRAGCRTETTR